jgi:uncharacterized protein (TIGR00299 family) protein
MKKILYIDCFSGISGDMMVGALLDLGIDFSFLKSELKKLNIAGYNIACREIKVGSLRAKKFDVEVTGPQPSRNYKDIKGIISESTLGVEIKKISLNVFKLIAEAEARIHGFDIDKIHFHEVGAVDSIVDIVSTAICIKSLGIESSYSSIVPLGSGFVDSSQGKLPVPAPVAVEILKEIPVYGGNFDFEVTTPTGAAIIKALAAEFGEIPRMEIERVGYGAGSSVKKEIPDVLRILKGFLSDRYKPKEENLVMLSANIDDSTPEIMGYLQEKLLKNKVLDVWTEPIYMKKTRPSFKLCVLCNRESELEIIDIILLESTTLGIRRKEVKRFSINRKIVTVKLPYGEVKIKIGIHKGKEINISPEFESCSKLAKKTGKPLKEIFQDAVLFFSRR